MSKIHNTHQWLAIMVLCLIHVHYGCYELRVQKVSHWIAALVSKLQLLSWSIGLSVLILVLRRIESTSGFHSCVQSSCHLESWLPDGVWYAGGEADDLSDEKRHLLISKHAQAGNLNVWQWTWARDFEGVRSTAVEWHGSS